MGDLINADFRGKTWTKDKPKYDLNREAIQIANEAFPSVIIQPEYTPMKFWPSDYRPPEKDPA